MTDSIRVSAPAKLNLTLEVVGRLRDGYHAIRSIFAKLHDVTDELLIEIDRDRDNVTVSSDSPEVPCDDTNLCHRAASRYLAAIGQRSGVHVHINKRIPVAAGLGGGSSDAAAVLGTLNTHFNRRMAAQELAAVGDAIGKDVPFFLDRCDVALVSGAGESIAPLPGLPAIHTLLVNPAVGVSTREAYQALSRDLWFMTAPDRTNASARMADAITMNDAALIAAAVYNDFELVIEAQYPVTRTLKQALRAFGAQGACMSGSGPTVFGMFQTQQAMRAAGSAIARKYPAFKMAEARLGSA
jgi:4-diphosphocytidyl-2-C-methyl-D-erythritol kinase